MYGGLKTTLFYLISFNDADKITITVGEQGKLEFSKYLQQCLKSPGAFCALILFLAKSGNKYLNKL